MITRSPTRCLDCDEPADATHLDSCMFTKYTIAPAQAGEHEGQVMNTLKRTDDQVRLHFFKQLTAAERSKVLRVFLDLSDDDTAEVRSHSIESKLLTEILRTRSACAVPPPGWNCTRGDGHAGPCAAVPADTQWEELFRTVALVLNCLPSNYIDGNEHVLKQAKQFTSFYIAAEGITQRSAADVLAERRRQMESEGYNAEHDDAHPNDEIAAYAALYAMPPAARDWPASETGYGDTFGAALCPVDWTPKFGDRRRELVKAAALLLAEIERIDRAAQSADKPAKEQQ